MPTPPARHTVASHNHNQQQQQLLLQQPQQQQQQQQQQQPVAEYATEYRHRDNGDTDTSDSKNAAPLRVSVSAAQCFDPAPVHRPGIHVPSSVVTFRV